MKKILGILFLFVLLIGCQNPEAYQNVSVEEAQQIILDQNVTVLDVRTAEEVKEGYIPKATFIPLQELSQRVNELDPQKAYLVVCRSGKRSAQASEWLAQNGFTQIYNMNGGMMSWDGDITK